MISSKVKRVTVRPLDGSFGTDRDKRIVVTFIPGDPKDKEKPDLLELKPIRARSQRTERIAVMDVYRYAVRCRVNLEVLKKARERKSKKAERLATERLNRAEKKLRERAKADCDPTKEFITITRHNVRETGE
jgi:hypothetical protein